MRIYCSECGRIIASSRPRTIIKGQWVCGDCTYYIDQGKPNPRAKEADPEQMRSVRKPYDG